eukprot:6653246-Pyramimonas_sp.AAC.1
MHASHVVAQGPVGGGIDRGEASLALASLVSLTLSETLVAGCGNWRTAHGTVVRLCLPWGGGPWVLGELLPYLPLACTPSFAA